MPFISGIGLPEVIIILVIALIVVGPGRLPDVWSALGKSIREFRKAATDVKEATSLEPLQAEPTAPAAPAAGQTAPTSYAPPAAAPVATDVATVAAPEAPPAAIVEPSPDLADMPEPVRSADEQPTPTP